MIGFTLYEQKYRAYFIWKNARVYLQGKNGGVALYEKSVGLLYMKK